MNNIEKANKNTQTTTHGINFYPNKINVVVGWALGNARSDGCTLVQTYIDGVVCTKKIKCVY